ILKRSFKRCLTSRSYLSLSRAMLVRFRRSLGLGRLGSFLLRALRFGPAARALAGLRIDVHHVARVDRRLALNAFALGILLRGLLVPPAQVDALDDDAPFLVERLLHESRASLVVAGDHDHRVALAHVHQTTSCASEMIFMKLRSRSSRATAPKMR